MTFLLIGESLVDAKKLADGSTQTVPGGSSLNVAIGLGRLGQNVTLVTQIADDHNGQLIREHLAANHVTVLAKPQKSTSVAHATIRPDGSAEYEFEIEWSPVFDHVIPEGVEFVHAGSIAAHLAPGGQETFNLLAAGRARAVTSYDPNCRPSILRDVAKTRREVERYVEVSDVVKASDEDIAWLYPGLRFREVADKWLSGGAQLVVVTRGGAGAWCATAEGPSFDAATIAVNVIDTIGAGDTFMAALLHGLSGEGVGGPFGRSRLRGLDERALREIIQQAALGAAIACTRAGANPPTLNELKLLESKLKTASKVQSGRGHA